MLLNRSQRSIYVLAERPVRLLIAVASLTLGACASVPEQRAGVFDHEHPLSTTRNERHRQVEQFVDSEALRILPPFALPDVRIAEGAFGEAIAPTQSTLVANHAARSVCLGLARYVELRAEPADGVLGAHLVVTAIEPTNGAAAGASSVIGFFAPVPLPRLPAGLGGLAIEAELRDPLIGQVALVRWARGANAMTQDPQVSSIGDAWQLAEVFGKEFTRAVLDTDPKKFGMQRNRLPRAEVKANRALCAQRFGKLNLGVRAASMLLPVSLPLAPGAVDPGAPVSARDH